MEKVHGSIFLHLLPFHGIIKRSCILYDIPMKRLFTVLLLISIVIVPVSASSWCIGGEAGYALNFMDTVTIWPRTEYRPGHGAEAAFIAEYCFDNGLSLSTGLRYIAKSFAYHHENSGQVVNDYMEMDHFLEFPLVLRYSFRLGDVSLFLGGGGYIGVWFLSQCFGTNRSAATDDSGSLIYDSHGDIIPFDSNDSLFAAGLIAETGVSWNALDDIRQDFAIRYERSLTSLVKPVQENTAHRYNDTLLFSVGCMVAVGGGK